MIFMRQWYKKSERIIYSHRPTQLHDAVSELAFRITAKCSLYETRQSLWPDMYSMSICNQNGFSSSGLS